MKKIKKVKANKNMTKEITKEEFWDLYEKLPPELKEAIFSVETADHISNICNRYEIQGEGISKVAKIIGDVLLGLLPLENLPNELDSVLTLEKDVIKKMNREVNRFIFFPIKTALKELYEQEDAEPRERKIQEEFPKSRAKDKYREPAE